MTLRIEAELKPKDIFMSLRDIARPDRRRSLNEVPHNVVQDGLFSIC